MFRLVRKPDQPPLAAFCSQLAAVAGALLVVALFMWLWGYNPVTVYSNMIGGALGSPYRLRATIHKAIPLALLSLAVSIAFRMKFWNVGAEGQMAMGGFGAAYVALSFPQLPAPLLLTLMFVAGGLCGAVWALIPAVLKAKLGTSETLVTLMLNYVALKWITYLQYGPWRSGGFPKIPSFSPNAVLPTLFGIHIGWVFALLAAFLVWVLLTRTKLGYEIAVIGESPGTARYAGINVTAVMLSAMLLSGALCGAVGMMQCSAVEKTLTEAFTGGLGFTAVITAWLAKLSPAGMIAASFAFSVLISGGSYLETSMRIPSSMAEVIMGAIILFVLGCDFFTRYKLAPVRREGGEVGGA